MEFWGDLGHSETGSGETDGRVLKKNKKQQQRGHSGHTGFPSVALEIKLEMEHAFIHRVRVDFNIPGYPTYSTATEKKKKEIHPTKRVTSLQQQQQQQNTADKLGMTSPRPPTLADCLVKGM